jgi:hypothetical protein
LWQERKKGRKKERKKEERKKERNKEKERQNGKIHWPMQARVQNFSLGGGGPYLEVYIIYV